MVKLDVDTLSTVPDAPPVAGPDRALDAPLADPLPPAGTGFAAVVERDVTRPTQSPITAHTNAAATTIHRLLFASNRRTLGRRAGMAVGAKADETGEEAGAGSGVAPVPPELPAASGA